MLRLTVSRIPKVCKEMQRQSPKLTARSRENLKWQRATRNALDSILVKRVLLQSLESTWLDSLSSIP